MAYKQHIDESSDVWLIPEGTLKQLAQHIDKGMSIESDAFSYLDSYLQTVLRMICADMPTKINDIENNLRTNFTSTFVQPCTKFAQEALTRNRKNHLLQPDSKLQNLIQRDYLRHMMPGKGDNSLVLFVIAVLEFLAKCCMEQIHQYRNYHAALKQQKLPSSSENLLKLAQEEHARNCAEISVADIKIVLQSPRFFQPLLVEDAPEIEPNQAVSPHADTLRRRKGSSSYEDAVKAFIQDHKAFIQEMRIVKKIFRPAFDKIAVFSKRSPLMLPEECEAVFHGVNDVLETSENFLDLLEESLEMEGYGAGVANAFEEMFEADDFATFRDYAKRVLESFTDGISPHEAVARILSRPESEKILDKYLATTPSFSEIIRYVLPHYLLIPVFRVSQIIESLRYFCSLLIPVEQLQPKYLSHKNGDDSVKEDVSDCLKQSEDELTVKIAVPVQHLMAALPSPHKRRMETLMRYYSTESLNAKLGDVIKAIEDAEEKLKEFRQSRLDLILECDFEKLSVGKKAPTARRGYLFESVLLLCKSNRQPGKVCVGPEYRLKEKFYVQKLTVVKSDFADTSSLTIELSSTDPPQQVVLKVKTIEDKELWLGWILGLQTKSFLEKQLALSDAAEEAAHPLHLPIPELYKFSAPDLPDNIVFDESESLGEFKIVKAATQEKLVERLTHHKVVDTKFVTRFLITFRSFMKLETEVTYTRSKSENLRYLVEDGDGVRDDTVKEKILLVDAQNNLLNLLKERYEIPEPFAEGSDSELYPVLTRKRFLKNYRAPVQTRVLVVIRHWVEKHFSDFENDRALLRKLQDFLRSAVPEGRSVMKTWIMTINKIINRKLQHTDVSREPQFPQPKPDMKLHLEEHVKLPPSDVYWMILHPVEIARQITLLEFDYYRAIRASELVDYKPGADERNQRLCPNIRKNASFSTKIANSLSKFIVETENLEERIAVVNRVIEIMRELFRLNNFYGVVDFDTSLLSVYVHRLSKTMEGLHPKLAQEKDRIEKICSTAHNHNSREYFRHLRSVNPPCIPFVGVYLTQLQQIPESNPEFLERDGKMLINFARYRRVANVVIEVQQFQNLPYCLEVDEHIRKWLEELDPYEGLNDHDFKTALYNQSLKIEPRDAASPPRFPKRFDFSLKSPISRPAALPRGSAGTLANGVSMASINSLISPGRALDDPRTPSSDSTPAQSPLYPLIEGSDAGSLNGEGDDVTLSEINCAPPPPPVPPRQPRPTRPAFDPLPSPRSLSSSSSTSSFSYPSTLLTPPARPPSINSGNLTSSSALTPEVSRFEYPSPQTPAAVSTRIVPSTPSTEESDSPPPPLPPKTAASSRFAFDDRGPAPALPPKGLKPDAMGARQISR